MGIHPNKICPTQQSMICPLEMINVNEAGTVYFVQHKSKSDLHNDHLNTTGKKNGKTSHFALAVDITGILVQFLLLFSHCLYCFYRLID